MVYFLGNRSDLVSKGVISADGVYRVSRSGLVLLSGSDLLDYKPEQHVEHTADELGLRVLTYMDVIDLLGGSDWSDFGF